MAQHSEHRESAPTHAVVLSAQTDARLRRYAASMCDRLCGADGEPGTSELTLAAVAYTVQTGRVAMPCRLAVTAPTLPDVIDGLSAFVAGRPHPAVRTGRAGNPAGAGIADLGDQAAAVAAWLDGADVRWRAFWPSPPVRVVLPAAPWDDEPRDEELPAAGAPEPGSPPLAGVAPAEAVAAAGRYLIQRYAEVSGIPSERLDLHTPLEEYGVSSLLVSALNARLEAELGDRDSSLLFAHRDLAGVAQALVQRHPQYWTGALAATPHLVAATRTAAVTGGPPPESDPHSGAIAIIGIAGRYPHSPNLHQLWANLASGADCVGMLPAHRRRSGWPVDLMWGGFLDDVDQFDPLLFGITPRDAELMDPQERLFLEVVWEALDDAGYPRSRLRSRHGSRVAVYAGAMYNEYPYLGIEWSRPGNRHDTGATLGGIANRVSFHFDLHGPSLTVDTMCSSSLVAIDLAVKALRAGEAEIAIAGAVNLSLHPNKFVQHHRMRLAAAGHRCRSFGAGGDGFVPAEGAGAVVLKPLRAALADDDPVHGMIRGTAVVHAGRTNGYLVPNPRAQSDMVERALRDAGIDPATIDYLEAHGAGTELGDPVEIEGLARVFTPAGLAAGAIPIGSVKSNLGHPEAAAGIAGLTKVLLQMRYHTLVPSLHAERLNPRVAWDVVPFRVQQKVQPWVGSGGPLRAGISSFGAGGTIAHVVVEQGPAVVRPAAASGRQLIVLSAYDEGRLRESARLLASALDVDAGLADVARTLQVGREPLTERLAVVVDGVDELRGLLDRFAAGSDACVLRGRASSTERAAGSVPPVPGPHADLEVLAQHWVRGGAVDWDALQPSSGRARTTALPSYPFTKRRCWALEPEQVATGDPGVDPAPGAAEEVPLYGRDWVRGAPVGAACMVDRLVVCAYSEHSRHVALAFAEQQPPGLVQLVREGAVPADGGYGYVTEAEAVALAGTLLDRGDIGGWLDLADLFRPDAELGLWRARLAMLQRMVGAQARAGLRILQVTRGLTGPDGPPPNLAGAPTAGFVRVLGAEDHKLVSSVLDTDRGSGETAVLVREIAGEWAVDDGHGEIGHRAGVRFHPALRRVDTAHRPLPVRPDGVYLVTGGTRGVGALVAGLLAERGARRLVLCGTRPPAAEAAANVAALRARGVDVLVHTVSVTDRPRLREMLSRARAEMGPLAGIVHCAGRFTGPATSFANRALPDADAVLEPKVDGLDAILELTADDRPDFIVLFSSVCAAVPVLAAGVTDYAAANAYLDQVAIHYHRSGDARIRSVNWPQWTETGGTSGQRNPCEQVGLGGMADRVGLRVLERVLAAPSGAPLLPAPPSGRAVDLDALVRVRTGPAAGQPAGRVSPIASEPVPACRPRPAGWLVDIFARTLRCTVAEVDVTARFGDLGVESVVLGELLRAIEDHLGRPLEPAILLENPTVERLSACLGADEVEPGSDAGAVLAKDPAPVSDAGRPIAAATGSSGPSVTGPSVTGPSVTGPRPDTRVAVVGMACRFPGAPDVSTFWANLRASHCTVDEVPASRWDHHRFYRPQRVAGASISKWGGFVAGIEEFDPDFFGLGDAEATSLDPSIRLFLEITATCLSSGGYTADELAGQDVGVFVGARMSESYGRRAQPCTDMLRSDQNFIAAHLAQHFDWRGPNLVVDSACSSSLVAVQLACRSLLAGETELALAGAVEVLLDEQPYVELSAARVLSPSGYCRVFDERADGFVPGEGCGVVLLKPLPAAIAAGDHVHAVIEGVAVNNDGRTMGMTTPSLDAQTRVIRRALALAGRRPDELGMIEAHGTGTMIGDPIELRALTEVLGTERTGWCPVGSVKSNIGHLLSAAGMAGLIKAVLALEHGWIPSTMFCDTPNPRFDFGRSPLVPNTELRPWTVTATARVAGVSSFGLGGTNAHLVASAADPAWTASHPAPRRALPPPAFRKRRLWLDSPNGGSAPAPAYDEPLVASLLDLRLTAGLPLAAGGAADGRPAGQGLSR